MLGLPFVISLFYFLGAVCLPLFACARAHATSLESETTAAANNVSETISGDGDFSDSSWNWNLGGSLSQTTTLATKTAPQIVDNTQGFTGGIGWDQDFMAGAGISYSATPDERLSNFGPNLYVGYTFKFHGAPSVKGKVSAQKAPPKKNAPEKSAPEKSAIDQEDASLTAEEKEEFVPSITLKVPLASDKYTIQPLTAAAAPTRRKLAAPAPVATEITQKSIGLDFSYNAVFWASLRVSYAKYTYDRDVNKFMANLDSPRAVRAGMAGMSSTVSGLPLNVYSFGVGFTPLDRWSLDIDDSITTQATDRSKSRALKAMVEREVNDAWKVGIGVENEHSVSLNQNLVLLKVVFNF